MGFSRQEYWSGVPLPSLNLVLTATNFFFFKIIINPVLQVVFLTVVEKSTVQDKGTPRQEEVKGIPRVMRNGHPRMRNT